MGRRLTYEYVRKSFEKEGYELLSKLYKNNKLKLDYICPVGHKHSITWNDWQQGYRCPYCAGYMKLDIISIKHSFEHEGYTLLTTKYKNAHMKVEYICPNGHKNTIRLYHWNNGSRCKTCSQEELSVRFSGNGNPCWKGGTSCEPYCQDWTKEYKEFIKERDGYKCLNPDCWKKDKVLTVHHIDYNKKNCKPANLITVCRSCNARANFNRKWHKAWYKAVMYRRYKG